MNKTEKEILALTECLVLWDDLSKTGSQDKKHAIKKLYRQGKLSCNLYSFDCPFCEYFRPYGSTGCSETECNSCIWPSDFFGKKSTTRCISSQLYNQWRSSESRKESRFRAKSIFEMLVNLP